MPEIRRNDQLTRNIGKCTKATNAQSDECTDKAPTKCIYHKLGAMITLKVLFPPFFPPSTSLSLLSISSLFVGNAMHAPAAFNRCASISGGYYFRPKWAFGVPRAHTDRVDINYSHEIFALIGNWHGCKSKQVFLLVGEYG